MSKPDSSLTETAYTEALSRMRANLTPVGYRAAPDTSANYNAVWGRDGSIAAIAAFETQDDELIEGGIRTLTSLAKYQASNGQIPAYLQLQGDELDKVVYGGLGNITSIDSNMWFVIACQAASARIGREEFLSEQFQAVYARTMRHLASLDSDMSGLIEVPLAGDWTDLLDRSYHILYDQVLWWRALRGAADLGWPAMDPAIDHFHSRAKDLGRILNKFFWWDRDGHRAAREEYMIMSEDCPSADLPYYQSHLQPFQNHWWFRFDAFANVLAALSGLAPRERVEQIIAQTQMRRLDQPAPLRVLDPVVKPEDEDWLSIYESRQQPYQNHNGASWPLAGGFWVALLAATGREQESHEALGGLAMAVRKCSRADEQWGFHEFLHGQTGAPMGRVHQTWSAAAYVIGRQATRSKSFRWFRVTDDGV